MIVVVMSMSPLDRVGEVLQYPAKILRLAYTVLGPREVVRVVLPCREEKGRIAYNRAFNSTELYY